MDKNLVAQELVKLAKSLVREADWDITHSIMELKDALEDEIERIDLGIDSLKGDISITHRDDRGDYERQLKSLENERNILGGFILNIKSVLSELGRLHR